MRDSPSWQHRRMPISAEAGIRNAHEWFESNSGWAQPDEDDLQEWVADGMCRAPDNCLVTPTGCCAHGLASWWLILEAQREDDARNYTGRATRAT
jgi:hypothetical protein